MVLDPVRAIALAALVAAVSAGHGPFPPEADPGGCRLERVAGADGENHVFHQGLSPDGRFVAVGWDRKVGSATQRGAYMLDLRTGKRRDLPGLNNAASFSPDGRYLVAANYADPDLRTEIVELEIATGKVRSLAPSPAGDWLPSYSPDGRWVVFNSTRSGGSDIYRVRRDGSGLERLTHDARYEAHATVSPDGRKILFHRQIAGDDYGLAVLTLATGRVRALAGDAREEAYPAWGPAGRRISYSGDAGQAVGQGDVYVARADGSGARRLTRHRAKDAYSAWSPDGRWLYFVSFRAEGAVLFRMRMAGGDCTRARLGKGGT